LRLSGIIAVVLHTVNDRVTTSGGLTKFVAITAAYNHALCDLLFVAIPAIL
jgi:hypothetical protein